MPKVRAVFGANLGNTSAGLITAGDDEDLDRPTAFHHRKTDVSDRVRFYRLHANP